MPERIPDRDLEDLRTHWQAQMATLDVLLATNLRLARAEVAGRLSARLRRLTRSLALGIAALVPIELALGSFLAGHAAQPRFLAPAVLVLVATIALGIALVRQLVLLRRLTPTAPVVALQREAERLRLERIRTSFVALAVGPLLWLPIVIVAAKGWRDMDLYAVASGAWIVANLGFGLAVIAVAAVMVRRYRRMPAAQRSSHRVLAVLSGEASAEVQAFLDELAVLEAPVASADAREAT